MQISDILSQDTTSKKWSWTDVVKKSTLVKKGDFLPTEAFEYDPDNFVYFRARSITANVPNGNGDYFDEKELATAYGSFVGKGFYIEHDSDSIEKAKGIILDSVWYPEGKYIECLVAVDRKAHADIARQVEAGILNAVSMGCSVEEAECSLCGNVAHTQNDLCVHMNPMSGAYCKGRIMPDGIKAHEINRKVTFSELSGVAQPADVEAHVFEVFASIQQSLLRHAADYQSKKAIAAGCPDGRCTLDVAIARLTPEERLALRASLQKTALNVQSPSTFQGNPAVDSGGANPKQIMQAMPSNTSGSGNIEDPLNKIPKKKPSFPPKKQSNVMIDPTAPVTSPDLMTVIQEEMKPVGDKIDEKIKEAIKSKIDGIVSEEVMRQVDALLSGLLVDAQLPIINEVTKKVVEHTDEVVQEINKVKEEIMAPPQDACAPEEFYGARTAATILLDKAIHALSNVLLTHLYAGSQTAEPAAAIEIGPEMKLIKEAGKDLLRLYRSGKATGVLLEPLNPEMSEMQKIARWRELLGIDMKTDTAETPKY
jgi:hypothetical protein